MLVTHRNDFLKLLAAGAAGLMVPASPQTAASSKSEQFAGRVSEDVGAAWRGACSYIGDRLGIFKAMASSGPVTAAELARKTGLNARLLREWLNAMAAAEYIEYQPAGRRYFLPPEHAAVLSDEESPAFLGGLLELIVPMVGAANKVADAFRTGRPITMNDFAPELFRGMERASAPQFKHQLVQEWIAAMPEVQRKLRDGGVAVDIGCGSGLASIVLARAFPRSRFFGYDPHSPSIERARANAKAAGLGDRVQFVAADSFKLPEGRFDLVTIFNTVHHLSNPVANLASARRSLTPGGACLFNEPALSPNVEENKNAAGRSTYAATTLWCLHDSMANNGAGIGSDTSEPLLRDLARKAGFTRFRRLPSKDPGEALYEVKA